MVDNGPLPPALPLSLSPCRVELFPEACAAVQFIRSFLKKDTNTCDGSNLRDKLEDICSKLSLLDLNYVLYRCDSEERDEGKGGGVYNVPGAGDMVYCGIQGVVSMVTGIRDNNDLGHPLCDNLRSGDWLPSYIVNRLGTRQSTRPVSEGVCLLVDSTHFIILPPSWQKPLKQSSPD